MAKVVDTHVNASVSAAKQDMCGTCEAGLTPPSDAKQTFVQYTASACIGGM
jgi:hypothetical protein